MRRTADQHEEHRKAEAAPAPAPMATAEPVSMSTLAGMDPVSRQGVVLGLQQGAGNAAIARAIAGGQVAAPHSGPVIAREPATIDVVTVEGQAADRMSSEELLEDNLDTTLGIFNNYKDALQNFETVVTEAAATEAIPKDTLLLVLDEVKKVGFGQLVSVSTAQLPFFGTIVSTAVNSGVGVMAAAEAEAAKAGENAVQNALKNMIVAERTRVGKQTSTLLSNKAEARLNLKDMLAKADDPGKKEIQAKLLNINRLFTDYLLNVATIEGWYQRLVERWISVAPKSTEMLINIDANWKVTRAHIKAPRGARVAEQLMLYSGNNFDLERFAVKRHLIWEPNFHVMVQAHYDAAGNGSGLTAPSTEWGKAFIDNLTNKGWPRTTVMSGD